MAEIKLKAILRAYTKTPFYNDFVRDVYSQKDVLPDTQYVRVYKENSEVEEDSPDRYTGEWVALDTALLEKPLEEFRNDVEKLNVRLHTIDVKVDLISRKLIFTTCDGLEFSYELPGVAVDYTTIKTDAYGRLSTIDVPDEQTIKEVDIEWENTDEEGNPVPNEYGITGKTSGKLRVTGIYVEDSKLILSGNELNKRLLTAEKNIKDLETYTQGTGGHLDPTNLGYLYRLNPSDDNYDPAEAEQRNIKLNTYAYTQLNSDGSNTPIRIPDQTKVQNSYDGILWVYIEEDNFWYNNGSDIVVQANNDGVLGVITGSLDKFKGKVENDATISINGLQEEFEKVVYSTGNETQPEPNSFVRRTTTGTVKVAESIESDDAINRGEFEAWQEATDISAGKIVEIVNALYFPEIGDVDGDGDIDIDWGPNSLDDGILG